jgi:DGQHR domain-containing protein
LAERPPQGLAAQILRSLPSDGTLVGNIRLRKKLGVSHTKFQDAREELVRLGFAEPGKGRGGSLRLIKGASQEFELAAGLEELNSVVRFTAQAARAELSQRREPASSPDERFENQAWRLMSALKPAYISVGRKPPIKLSSGTICPDVIALFSTHKIQAAVLVECKFSSDGAYPSAFLAEWLSKLRQHRNELRKLFTEKLPLQKLLIVGAVNDVSNVEPRLRSEGGQLGVKWLDSRQVEYFQKVHDETGIGIGHLFWSTIAPETISLQNKPIPAMKVKSGQGSEAYIFSANAHDILDRAYVSHRELEGVDQTAYQRMFKKHKLKAIREYINKFSTFPTPIVVAFDQRAGQVFDKDEGRSEVDGVCPGRIHLPNRPKSIQVIDGQHRLFGYSLVEPDASHVIHVVAYKYSKDLDAARLFVDINGKQTPVPKNLLWELYPDIYSKEDREYFKAMISRAVEDQIEPHLLGRVSHISLHSRGQITFQTICKEVERTRLVTRKGGSLAADFPDVETREKKLSLILDSFFFVLESFEQDFPVVSSQVMYTNVGLIPMIRIYARILKYESARGTPGILQNPTLQRQILTDYFRPIYAHYHQKGDENLRRWLAGRSSEGAFNELDDELTKVIQNKYRPGFPARQTAASQELERAADDVGTMMDEINALASRGSPGHWIFREFQRKTLLAKLKRREFNEDSFHSALHCLRQEIIEGSESETGNNALLDLLKVKKVDQVPVLDQLNLLRNYTSHKKLRDEERMKRALQTLRALTKRNDLFEMSEITASEFETALIALLNDLKNHVLEPALQGLRSSLG